MLFGGQGWICSQWLDSTTTLDAMPPCLRTTPRRGAKIACTSSTRSTTFSRNATGMSSRSTVRSVKRRIPSERRCSTSVGRSGTAVEPSNGGVQRQHDGGGSVPEGASLLEDFRALANMSLNLPEGSSTFTWTAATSGQSTVSWALSTQEGPGRHEQRAGLGGRMGRRGHGAFPDGATARRITRTSCGTSSPSTRKVGVPME